MAGLHVHYYNQNIVSKSINNVSNFKKDVACSGTIWNHATYHKGFGKAELDPGTEGSILNLLSTRTSKNESIYELPDTHLESFLYLFKTHPQKKTIRALVDGGGFLKDYSNEMIAKELIKFFVEEGQQGPPIEAIIYLHQFSKEEMKQGKPKEGYVLLKKAGTRHLLNTTSESEIKKHGIKIDNLFALFDELRATGTDIPLGDQARFLNTIDHKMPIRSFLQAVLRARKIFKGQEADYIVTSKGREEMISKGKTFTDLKNTMIKNEAIMLKEQIDRARFAKIEDVIRSAIMQELRLEKDFSHLKILIKKYRDFLVSQFEDNPYREFGRIHGQEATIEVLTRHAKQLLDRFEKAAPLRFQETELSMNNLLARFQEEILPDEKMSTTIRDDLNATVELEQEQETELEQEIELNPEIEQELNQYTITGQGLPYQERFPIPGSISSKQPLFNQLQNLFSLTPLTSTLNQTYDAGKRHISTAAYVPCFENSKLWATKNFSMTYDQALPLFHPKTKRADFILAIPEKDQHEFILISKAEAAYFKTLLGEDETFKAYLLDLKGNPEINSQLFEQKILQGKRLPEGFVKGLWYANLFNGNIDFLDKHESLSIKLMKGKEQLFARFMQLRIGNKSQELNQFYSSKLFEADASLREKQTQRQLFSRRRNKIEMKYNQTRLYGKEQVAHLSIEEVKDLAIHQVQWLTQAKQIAYLPDDLLDHLVPHQLHWLDSARIPLLTNPNLIGALRDKKQICQLNSNQLSHIIVEQIPLLEDRQMEALPNSICRFITEPAQVRLLRGEQVQTISLDLVNSIDPEQLVYLEDEQIRGVNDPLLIKKISSTKITYLRKEFRKHIDSVKILLALIVEQIPLLEDRQMEALPNSICRFITEPAQVRLLRGEQVQTISLDLVNSIDPEQLVYLEDEQIRGVNDPLLIKKISSTKITYLRKEFRKHIDSVKILLALPDSEGLLPEQKEKIKVHLTQLYQTQKLDEKQLQWWYVGEKYLPKEAIKELTQPDLIYHIPLEWADQIQESQAKHLRWSEEKLIGGLIYPVFKALSYNLNGELPYGLGNPFFLLDCLLPEQIKQLEEKDEEFIQKISLSRVEFLTDAALQKINSRLVNQLSDQTIKRLTAIHLLLAIEDEKRLDQSQKNSLQAYFKDLYQTKRLDEKQLKLWHVGEKYLPKEAIKELKRPDLICHIPQEWVDQIQASQVKHLGLNEEKLIQALPYPVFKAISYDLLDKGHTLLSCLLPEQIAQLEETDEEFIKSLYCEIDSLKDAALQKINRDPEFVNQLSDQTIKRLTAIHLLLVVEDEKRLDQSQKNILQDYFKKYKGLDQNLLKIWHLRYLTKENIQDLKRPDLICNIPTSHAAFITQGQVRYLTKKESHLIPFLTYPALKFIHPQLSSFLNQQQISQLQKDDGKLIQQLPVDKFAYLGDEALQMIPSDSVQLLSKDLRKRLKNPELLLKLTEITQLEEFQKGILKKGFENCSSEEISRLPVYLLKFLPNSKVSLIPFPVDRALAPLPNLSVEQYAYLTPEQIRVAIRYYSFQLDKNVVNKLNRETLEALPKSYVYELTKEGVEKLDGRKGHLPLIQEIKDASLLSAMNKEALNKIKPEQVQYLDKKDWPKLEKVDLLLAFSDKNSKDLTNLQKKSIQDYLAQNYNSFIEQDHRNSPIKPWHVEYLPEIALSRLNRLELIRSISPDFYPHLTKQQASLLNFDSDKIKKLSYPAFTGIRQGFLIRKT